MIVAVPVPQASEEVGHHAEHGSGGHHQRNQRKRSERQHGDENELLGNNVEVAELEADARNERISADEAQGQNRIGGALGRQHGGQYAGDHQEDGSRDRSHDRLVPWHSASATHTRFPHELLRQAHQI